MSSKRREIAQEVTDAYQSWDIERIMAYRTDNCVHQVAPGTCLEAMRGDSTLPNLHFTKTLALVFHR